MWGGGTYSLARPDAPTHPCSWPSPDPAVPQGAPLPPLGRVWGTKGRAPPCHQGGLSGSRGSQGRKPTCAPARTHTHLQVLPRVTVNLREVNPSPRWAGHRAGGPGLSACWDSSCTRHPPPLPAPVVPLTHQVLSRSGCTARTHSLDRPHGTHLTKRRTVFMCSPVVFSLADSAHFQNASISILPRLLQRGAFRWWFDSLVKSAFLRGIPQPLSDWFMCRREGSPFVLEISRGLNKCIMTGTHNYSVTQSDFTALYIPHAPPAHLSLPTCTEPLSFGCLQLCLFQKVIELEPCRV